MRRGSRWAGTALLVFTAGLSLFATAAAQGPQGCVQEPLALPTWLGLVPDPGRNAEGFPGEERARDVLDRLHSPEYLSRLEVEKTRLQREVFGDILRDTRWAEEPTVPASNALSPAERIYLFISESIPLETLRNYARDIAEMGDPGIVMVLRGFIGGMRQVLPTRRFVLDVLRKDLACDPEARTDCELYLVNLVIDPLLFRLYGVREVPAVVYALDTEATGFGRSEEPRKGATTGRFWRISGDAGLGHLLRRIQLATGSGALTSVLRSSP
ncbi:MAG: TrbC family F-type conjugative pilus assembly protein [Deferrisomatales bacterium]|nr:TrbC family F-type conjugative pilus assembly protein [Deferrisomatales bacterium]